MAKIVDWATGKRVKRGSGDNGYILPKGSKKLIKIKGGKRIITAKDLRAMKKANKRSR